MSRLKIQDARTYEGRFIAGKRNTAMKENELNKIINVNKVLPFGNKYLENNRRS